MDNLKFSMGMHTTTMTHLAVNRKGKVAAAAAAAAVVVVVVLPLLANQRCN